MEEFVGYLKDTGYLPDNFSGNHHLDIVINRWEINQLPTKELPFKESWTLIIKNNLVTGIIRNLSVYTLKQAGKDTFIYKNGDFSISMCINIAATTGYFYKLSEPQFTYQLWC